MRITGFEIGDLRLPLKRTFTTSRRSSSEIVEKVIRVRSDAGHTGFGSAPQLPAAVLGTAESLDDIGAGLSAAAPMLMAAGNLTPESWWALVKANLTDAGGRPLPGGAKAAIDIALWDLWAQNRHEPLYRLFGGARDRVRTDLTISLDTPDAMAQAAREAVDQEFHILKVKLGHGEITEDVARLAAVAAVAQPGVQTLRVDGNQGWTVAQTLEFAQAIKQLGIKVELIEQPVEYHDLDGLAHLVDVIDVPILADESVRCAQDARTLLDRRAADQLNIKLMKSWGLSGGLDIAAVASAAGVPVMVGSMLESAVGATAALALACGQQCVQFVDLDTPLLAATNPVRGGLLADGDILRPSPAPGLGIDGIDDVTWVTA